MQTIFYSYGNIIRILNTSDEVTSLMIDVNIEKKDVLSIFNGERKFDADFIKSFLNILSVSKVGFRILSETKEDNYQRVEAIDILENNKYDSPEVALLLDRLS